MNSTTLGKYRWRVCALLFVATTINYIDRQVLGLLKTDLSAEFNWTETDYSNLVMAFSAAYSVGLLCFGALIDKIGSKLGYAVSIAVWSLSAMAHGIVRSTLGFGVVRSILGVSEAGNFPAAIKATAEWFPKKERALATGIFNSGSNIAAVVGPVLVYWLARNHGWRSAFVWTGAIGFIWLVLWWIYYEVPSKQKKLSKEEYDHIHSDQEEEGTGERIKWAKLLGVRQTYAFVFGKLLTDPVWWFFLFWLPGYLESIFHMDLKANLGLPIIIIYSVTSLGSIGGGWLSSHLIKTGWPVFKARKTSMLIFAICVVPIMLIQYTNNLWIAIALISLATAAHQAWSATIFTTASDMFPKRAVSSVVGIGGMAGSIGGTLFPMVIGAMLDHYKLLGNIGTGYNILFTMCGVAYLVAWTVMHFFAPKMERVNL
ncbi:MFS transporter [Chitinophaga silvatica]|uniref:MFS transporter n=1 Tax=Chitinophaga silvatica TaxID=2282649 RepID=A0A3E1YDR8_9BACT|nr:MFS transporter [Chitinophaga silvatica]RFS24676.1 MFS transporter [Chitinophaga silvatica]